MQFYTKAETEKLILNRVGKIKLFNIMKFKKFKNLRIEKSKMNVFKGGTACTSTTEYTTTGYAENEQELDDDGNKIGKPKLVEFPD